MMNRRDLGSLVVVLALVLGGVSFIHAVDLPETAAQKALESWMPLWDSGKYDESYDKLAESTKKDISKRQWFEYWSTVRKPLGNVKSRKLKEVKYFTSLPNLPNHEGAMLQYEGSFESKGSVVETFGMVRETNGTWRVANYLTQ